MRFRIYFFGVDILELNFAWPARGVYPVPEFIDEELAELASGEFWETESEPDTDE